MILQTRAAKIILLLLAAWLMGCAIVVAFTGWDGKSSPRIGTSASSPTAQPAPSVSGEPPPAETPQTANIPEELKPVPTPELWSPPPADAVYVSPRFQGARPGQEITFQVMANLMDRGISGAEFEVIFRGEVLQARSLRPGDLLGANPLIAADSVDNDAGILHYASARKGTTTAAASEGVLVDITFDVPSTAASGTYPLVLRDVILTDERFESISGLEILGATFEVVE